MTCEICGHTLAYCTCPDADQRLRNASDSDTVLMKWCRICDKHYARCRCDPPDFGVRTGGKLYGPEYLNDAVTLSGQRVRIDPTIR